MRRVSRPAATYEIRGPSQGGLKTALYILTCSPAYLRPALRSGARRAAMIRGMPRQTRALAVAVAAATLALQLTAAPLPAQVPDAAPAARQVTFRLIVVSTESAARGVLERLQRGGAAEAIAAAESIDPSAARGGLIGPVVLAELRAELRDALAPLAPGQLTGIVRLPTGFGVAQLAEPTAGRRSLRSSEIAGIGAIGAVQPTVSVDGFAEANTVYGKIGVKCWICKKEEAPAETPAQASPPPPPPEPAASEL